MLITWCPYLVILCYVQYFLIVLLMNPLAKCIHFAITFLFYFSHSFLIRYLENNKEKVKWRSKKGKPFDLWRAVSWAQRFFFLIFLIFSFLLFQQFNPTPLMLGVTSPLSLASSSESDYQLQSDLVTVLQQQKAYEPNEKTLLR